MSHSSAAAYPSRPPPPASPQPNAEGTTVGLLPLFAAESVNSIAGTLLTVGLPFYTSHRFGWGARENFAVAACQGALYVAGALSAQALSRRWGRDTSLFGLCIAMTAFAVGVGVSASLGWAATTVLLVVAETGLMGASWPILESLISAAGEPSRLSQRLGHYNVVWAATGAIALAASGAIIQHARPWAYFGTIATGHLLAGVLVLQRTGRAATHAGNRSQSDAPIATDANRLHRAPSDTSESTERLSISRPVLDERTARRHRLALWLSRIALPSTYVVIYSLAPALPSLHAIQQLSPTSATLVASIWFIARTVAFVITGRTTFWHQRPTLMLWASVTMLFAFLGTVVPGALSGVSLPHALLAMAVAQTILGFSVGTIYSASLYFGMAVSEGSTEHGGYHEALIGLGQILGPVLGAVMQYLRPGAVWPAVVGIAAIVALTVVIEAIVGMRVSRRTVAFSTPE